MKKSKQLKLIIGKLHEKLSSHNGYPKGENSENGRKLKDRMAGCSPKLGRVVQKT